jgi:predicted CXXCH cytochrome family protein
MTSRRSTVRIPLIGVALAAFVLVACAVPALAYKEGGADIDVDNLDCEGCHAEPWPPSFTSRQGPHGSYSSSTAKCAICHTVHVATGDLQLLPRDTIADTCMACHDGTGGYGVYGTISARGEAVGASHRIDTTSAVPGGDPTTGGSATRVFGGENGYLSCDDCHSPHDSNTVDPFSGERIRFHVTDLNWIVTWESSHLLRQRPTGADTTVTAYGADWCATCHEGRSSGGAVHNHPADTLDETATPFYYDRVAIVTSNTSLLTTLGPMGLIGTPTASMTWHNRGYVMPYPRTAEQTGHNPICQQCHEDSRDVGSPGNVTSATVTGYGDGHSASDNPRFQTFPHETMNEYFLVETGDNLCLNCHPATTLP